MRILLLPLTLVFMLCACGKDQESQAEKDDKIIQQYLADNSIEATKHNSGIYYKILKSGSGAYPSLTNTVSVTYKGYLTDGTIFDETATPLNLQLTGVIRGWQFAVPMLKPGGKGLFFIPSGLAYGNSSVGSIPANSVLIFEITLVDFY